jgi:hypothetical protein
MERNRLLIALGLLALFVLATGIEAQQIRKAGLNAGVFLKIGVGARAVGLGSAVTTISGDANQIFWNPAGTALQEERFQASFSYNKWIADLKHNAAAITYNMEGVGTIGLGFISFGVSDIPADRDIYTAPDLIPFQIDQNPAATYDYRDLALAVSFSRYFFDKLALGVTTKYVHQKIDDQNVSAIAFDFGSIYKIGLADWQIGARLQNLASDFKYYDISYNLPLTFSIGSSIKPYKDENNSILLAVDGVKTQDGPQYVYAGGEYTLMNMVSVRGGYKLNYSGVTSDTTSTRGKIKATIEGVSLGAGLNFDVSAYNIKVDYAFTKMDLFDNVHRITVRFGWK